jgi:guanylate kinase
MAQAKAECSHYQEFDYIIVNDEFEKALENLTTIVNNQRLKRRQQAENYQLLFKDLLAND